jgi:hypothetical protein
MSSHTIKVFTVYHLDGTVHLQYIDHNSDKPTEDGPGHPISLKPGEKVRWKNMSGAPITVDDFKPSSPFKSGETSLPKKPPKALTEYGTIKNALPNPDGSYPSYKYTVTVQGVLPDDPDVIIDLGSGGGHKPAAKAAAKQQPKPKPKPKGKKK